MTRSEFRQAAGEAGVNPNIYGLIIDECMYCKGYSRVTGGKVVGIKWNEEWVTKKETYRPFALINGPTHTALGKVPYIVLKKGNQAIGTSWWIGRFRTPYHTASFPPLVQQIGSQHYIQKAMCRSF